MNLDHLKGGIGALLILCVLGFGLGQTRPDPPEGSRPLEPIDFARAAIRPLMEEHRQMLHSIDRRLSTLVTATEGQTAAIEEQTAQLERIGKALEDIADEPVSIHVESFGATERRRESGNRNGDP